MVLNKYFNLQEPSRKRKQLDAQDSDEPPAKRPKLERIKMIADGKGRWKRVSVPVNDLIVGHDAPMFHNAGTDMLTQSDILVHDASMLDNAKNDMLTQSDILVHDATMQDNAQTDMLTQSDIVMANSVGRNLFRDLFSWCQLLV